MGEESKKFAPTCSAISTTARAFLLALSPRTSKVRHVPIPTTGTCKPLCPRFRLSMFLSFLVVIVALSLALWYTANIYAYCHVSSHGLFARVFCKLQALQPATYK